MELYIKDMLKKVLDTGTPLEFYFFFFVILVITEFKTLIKSWQIE